GGQQQHGGGAVADLARIAGSHHAVLLERWLQLRHLFARRRDADAFVSLERIARAVALYVDGKDLAAEPAFLDRLPGFAVALVGKLVELFAREAPFLRDHLRRAALRDDPEQVCQFGTHRALAGAERDRTHRLP